MNIHELDSFDLADAVKFNDELNPRIWQGSRMRPEVRRKLLAIAKDFKQSLGLTDLEVKDITVSGSNAGYTYTPHSDIDLHLVVDIPQADSSEVYRELFNAKKYQYNDEHNLVIGGYPVELYVENANEPPVSQGMFSVLANDWINIPRKRKSTVNDNAVKSKYELMKHRVESAIASEDIKQLTKTAARIKQMRQAGLAKNGELGPENLAYKILRTQGLIEKLYAARTAAKDRQLSLQERKKKKSRVRYGFGGYWAPGFGFGSEGGGDGGGGGESVREDATISPYGVNPTTQMFLNETDDDEQTVRDFIEHTADRLGIERMPEIELHSDPEWSQREHSFGRYTPDTHTLEVNLANRHIMDILRTVAHELVHCRQHELSPLPDEAGETGSRWENEAHAKAGELMRDYADAHPEYFDSQTLEEGLIKNAGAAVALSTAMAMTPAQAQQYLPQDQQQQQVQQQGQLNTLQILNIARTIHSLKNNLTRAGAEEEINQEFKNYLRATQGDPNAQNLSRLWQLQQRKQQQQQPQQPLPSNQYQREDIAEASGYIPTDAEKNDPRFVMALSPDVRPGATGKNANKMSLKTNAQGRPALLMKEFANQLHEEFEQFDESVALFEIKMTGKNLRAEAAKTGAIAGMEFEMIVPNMERDPDDNDDDEMEPDWDLDEGVNSIEDACDFFDNGENNSSGDIRRLRDRMQEDYWEWQGEQFDSRWDSDDESFVYDYLKENAGADEIAEILGVEPNEDGEYPDPDREAYRNASEKVVEQGYGNFWYDAARESAQEDFNQSATDESEWLSDRDINTMKDVMDNFGNVDWPYYYAPSSYDNDGATIEDVANDFQDAIGRNVQASGGYHSSSVERPSPSSHHYVVEPDGSLEGDNTGDRGLEFVSPPLPVDVILNDLNKVKRWASSYGCYTNDSTGLHINISVPNYSRENLDFVKLAILMGDEYVSESFGRLGAFYAKSAMGMIRDNIRSRPEAVDQALEKMKTHLDTAASKAIHSGVTAKYTSINVKDGHIEFRSPGGDWLDENFDKIENTLLRFTVAMSAATNPEMYREEYLKKLYKLLNPDGIKDEYGDMIQEFAKYMTSLQGDGKEAGGKLSKETQQAIKDFRKVAAQELQQKNLSNKLKKGDTGGQRYWWNVSWGNGRIEVVASTKEEAIDTAFNESYWAPDEPDTPQAIQFRGSLRAKPLRPYEETSKQSKPFVWKVYGSNNSPYQRLGIEVVASNELDAMKKARKEWDLNVGGRTEEEFFSTNGWSAVRVREAPAEQTPNYQIYNRQTNTALPGEEFWAKDDDDALTRLADYQLHGPHRLQPGQADRMFGVRTANGVEVVGLDIPLAAPRAATSPTGQWKIIDGLGREVYRFRPAQNTRAKANELAASWAREYNWDGNYQVEPAEETADNWSQDFERRMQSGTSDQQQGGLIDVAGSTNDLARQRATPGTFTGAWKVLDANDNELYIFSGIGNNQSDANRVAVQWMRSNGYDQSTDISVVPIMSEGIAESMPQPSQGPGKYRDLNEPLGPETPPQMPAGTTKVDVSDTQDWYQLGMDISNISAAKPEEYNQGPPHTVIVFPSDEFEQPYLKQFKRLGLKTHDIDPPGKEDIDEGAEFFSMPLRMSEYRGKHHPATKQPYDSKFKFSGDLKDRVHGMLDAGAKPTVLQVNPRHLLATQDWLSSQGGGKPPFATMKQHPVVLQKNNKMYILDGHHRSADALKSGTPIEVYLFKDEL
jgi:hypothetical protein